MENKRIDIEECEYINGFCYKTGMLCKDVAFCNIRRIQQLKAENEKLCTAIRNELPEQYNKRVSEAESDIAWGVLDRNTTEAEFCKKVIYETRNYIAELKAENEELRARNSRGMLAFLEEDFKKEQKIKKYKQCLDEIEEICQNETINLTDSCVNGGRYFEILQLIKQAKEGEE